MDINASVLPDRDIRLRGYIGSTTSSYKSASNNGNNSNSSFYQQNANSSYSNTMPSPQLFRNPPNVFGQNQCATDHFFRDHNDSFAAKTFESPVESGSTHRFFDVPNKSLRHSRSFEGQSQRKSKSALEENDDMITPKMRPKSVTEKPNDLRYITSEQNTPANKRQTPSQVGTNTSILQSTDNDDVNENFKVAIRVRPPLARELNSPFGFANIVRIHNKCLAHFCKHVYVYISFVCIYDIMYFSFLVFDGFNSASSEQSLNSASSSLVHTMHSFTFDHVHDESAKQKDVYESIAREAAISTLQGYNASIIAYGQTSAGKTYTMEGFDSDEQRGIIPRAIEEIFQCFFFFVFNVDYLSVIEEKASPTMRFLVRTSYLQIYNEVISDLLESERGNLQIREDKKKGLYVEGLSEWVVRNPAEIYGLIKKGASLRMTCSTKLNELSSRSHAIFIIIVEQNELSLEADQSSEDIPEQSHSKVPIIPQDTSDAIKNKTNDKNRNCLRQQFRVGKLNLVDLAGSER
ncbi:hypothetical protein RFI_27210, partial [Reticulomyxa filosa]